ncbi:DUF6796 family protein [Lachnoclostridium sp. Marseille-P6806]|uniref:DUF6796 family protein n=1 Tax=Lachnoclostridium sp. Marseille-P6806 TaxID=2364793 RepID=UPI00102FCCF1|nr:DUF6796 family protein [Lachnoclostridium sp. Marseille-P6806]
MKKLTSRKKILLGVWGMVLFIMGDYLLGLGTIGTSSEPDALYGMMWNVAPDWRYAGSSLLGFAGTTLFAVAAVELLKVMETKYGLSGSKLYQFFKTANWGGILYFAFIHIIMSVLPVVFNAGMEATGDMSTSAAMVIRVTKSIAVPLLAGFLICDGFVAIGWIGLVLQGKLPLPKIALICNPVVIALLGQSMNLIAEGLDSGFESFGWLLMYLVCALKLVGQEERV